MASDKVVQLSDDIFEQEVLRSPTPVLVDFWASWCAPCKAISPVVDALADDYQGKVKIGKLNVDENPATPGQYGVRGIPTLILFKDGKVVDQVVGAVTKNQLEGLIKKAL
jgi:thioredoxin 1